MVLYQSGDDRISSLKGSEYNQLNNADGTDYTDYTDYTEYTEYNPSTNTADDDCREHDQSIYAAALAGIESIGRSWLARALESSKPSQVWSKLEEGKFDSFSLKRGQPNDLAKLRYQVRKVDLTRLKARLESHQVGVTYVGAPDFPAKLVGDQQVPPVLFCKGSKELVRAGADVSSLAILDSLCHPMVSIIGTRNCSHYGRECAYQLGYDLSSCGVSVISGLAQGIDGAAHRGALDANQAFPIGVVASGLNLIYPSQSRDIWNLISERGILLSEYPLGAPAQKWHFPARNRIIAALSDVVIVVESRRAGGAMHTVNASTSRNIQVMAVPGSIRSPVSQGTNDLIYDGALMVRDATDVLVALGYSAHQINDTKVVSARDRVTQQTADATASGVTNGLNLQPGSNQLDLDTNTLTGKQTEVLQAIGYEPTLTSAILNRCHYIDIGEIHSLLYNLESLGFIRSGDGWWTRLF